MKRAIAAFALVLAAAGGCPLGTAFAAAPFDPDGACRAVVVRDLRVLAVRSESGGVARVDCNLVYNDGCDAYTSTNVLHCGDCNHPSPSRTFCAGGIRIVG